MNSVQGTFTVTWSVTASSVTLNISKSGQGDYFTAQLTTLKNSGDSVNTWNPQWTGLQSDTIYSCYVRCRNGDSAAFQVQTSAGGGSGGGGSTATTDIGDQTTTLAWSKGSTLWADENHAAGASKDSYTGYWHGSAKAVVPGYSWQIGYIAQDGWTVDHGYVYAKSTVGAYCEDYVENDDNTVTYTLTTRVRSRLYQNYPWHGIKVTYVDDSGTTQTKLQSVANFQSGVFNNGLSGSASSTWSFLSCTSGWANQSFSLTFTRGATAVNRSCTIQLSNIGGTPSNNSNTINKFTNTLVVTLPVPASPVSTITAATESSTRGTAKVNNTSSVTVQNGTVVTFSATANTGWGFTGWYNGSTLVSQSNPYSHTANGNITLTAHFEDITPKVSYLIEHVTNKAYALRDGTLAHGSGTTNRMARWSAADTLNAAPIITGATTVPTSLTNGYVTAVNNESSHSSTTYVNNTSWQYGPQADYGGGDLIRASIRVVFQRETATTITYRVYSSLSHKCYYVNASGGITWRYLENGVNKTPYKNNPNLSSSDFVYNNYTSDSGWSYWAKGNGSAWYDVIDNVNNASAPLPATSSASPCNFYKDVTISKTAAAQTFTFSTYVATTYSSQTSTATVTVTIPPLGYTVAVGYSSSVKKGRPYVKYNNAWHDAIMWVKVNGTWIKGHYY